MSARTGLGADARASGRIAGRRRARRLWAATLLGLLPVVSGVQACSPSEPPPLAQPDAEAHRAEIVAWRQWRHEQLTRPDGWLTLVGLYWLPAGRATFGAAPEADLRLEVTGAPALIGSFERGDGGVTFRPAAGAEVTIRRRAPTGAAAANRSEPKRAVARPVPADGIEIWPPPEGGDPPVLQVGSVSFFVIERDERLALRVKDADSPLRLAFAGIDSYPVSLRWRLAARFIAHEPPLTIHVPSVLGSVHETDSPGSVEFEIDGVTYRLDLWKDSDDPANFFTAFGDATNGDTTYGGGRFLWIDAPDEYGRTVVDFNKAYNPPCVFTPFATCPLPPRQNRLPVRIEAGEKRFGEH